MERVRIALPESFPFRTELDVRIGDVNYGGHLAHDAILALLQEARLRLLAGHGFTEMDAGGAGLILLDAAVEYRAQAFHGDRLAVEAAVGAPARAGFEMLYRVSRPADGADIARARTNMAFFDYAHGRVAPMPAAFREAFFAAERPA